jgi:hypothetical protein
MSPSKSEYNKFVQDQIDAKLKAGSGAAPKKESPVRAKGRTRNPRDGKMNKMEANYAAELERRKANGGVAWYGFECIKLRLADNTYYIPDFLVMLNDGTMEIHETKGYWEDDARVKIKACADLYWMFVFRAITIKAGHYQIETFNQPK